jgi:protein-S-isoprenylcysteine O-methyltransferase Ste14
MDRAFAVRALALYAPAAVALLLVALRRRTPRLFAAALTGFAWSVVSLHALQAVNVGAGWWTFHATGGLMRGMPVDLLLGWAVLWGIVPILAFPRGRTVLVLSLFLAIDLVLMPACGPVVDLHSRWLVGELVALGCVLAPSYWFARTTLDDRCIQFRAVMHVATFAAVVLLLIPEIIFAVRPGAGWNALSASPAWLLGLELQVVALTGVMGVSAVQEFAHRGGGTPIPYDPPKRLVTSGFYAYLANPMQFSMTAVMIAWGIVLMNPWVTLAGVMAFIYGAGLARSDEGDDMLRRFGDRWLTYRMHVRAWVPRWRPWHDPAEPPAVLYVAESCAPCSEVRRWFDARDAIALRIVAAEDHPRRALRRITYEAPGGHAAEGVEAVARGLEHINLGWAFAGACLRLPGVSHFVQLLLDTTGLGPRAIPRRADYSHCDR